MISATSAVFLALLLLATGVAVAAGPNLDLAVPAGGAAVAFAAALGLENYLASRGARPAPYRLPDTSPSARIRRAFAGGRIPREEIVLLLDHVERAGPNPALPSRAHADLASIVELPPAEFRRYVSARLDRLEREA